MLFLQGGVRTVTDDKETLDGLFVEFYKAVNGFEPYEWQCRLMRHVAADGRWPHLLDCPTGSGKTAVLEIHAFLNAFAGRLGVSEDIPRRMVVAVNRRSLVDSQYLHASEMAVVLRQAIPGENDEPGQPQPVLAQVAVGLMERWGESGKSAAGTMGPLMVASMRGGSDAPTRDNAWRLYPEGPMIACATPDMIGSRLLFRGYGMSRMMRPVEAGLLACDSVLVIDEAHGNRQLALTARRISELEGASTGAVALPLQVVESTATPSSGCPRSVSYDRIRVTEEDLESDDALAIRISKPKLLQLRSTDGGSVHFDQIADMAFEALKERDGVVAVLVNTVKAAVAVEGKLRTRLAASEGELGALDIVCVLGRMRPFDRMDSVRHLKEVSEPGKRGFIVGTQALEVGLNYDCRTMVTELCPASALVQRLGRVNRFGRFSDGMSIVVDGGAASKGPYEQSDLDIAREWVRGVEAMHPDGVSAFDLARMEIPDQSGKRSLYQRLEFSDIECLSHTSEHLGAEEGVQTIDGSSADLALWLRDELGRDVDRDVSLAVRSGLPTNAVEACDMLMRIPPLEEELFPCSYSELRGVIDICSRGNKEGLNVHSTGEVSEGSAEQGLLILASEDGQHFHPMVSTERLVPGGVYVVDASAPVFRGPVIAPRSEKGELNTAVDVYNQIALQDGVGDAPFVLDDFTRSLFCDGDASRMKALAEWESELKEAVVESANDPDGDESPSQVVERFAESAAFKFPEGSDTLLVAQNLEAVPLVDEGDLLVNDVALIYHPAINSADASRLEIGGSREVLLGEHAGAVSALARRISQSVGLSSSHEEIVAMAGAHHDDGKIDPRFQRMLAGGRKPTRVLAKGQGRSRSDIIGLYKTLGISGWRHEQLSAVMLWDGFKKSSDFNSEATVSVSAGCLPEADQELIVRLVGTSHGRGRATFDFGIKGLCADEALACELDSSMDELFGFGVWESIVSHTDELYGYWGVAYLEAVVRAADARVSAEEQRGGC